MIRFKGLHAEGFGSIINPTGFDLDQEGLNIIRGKVGSGKTTIPSILTWTLFGQPLKHKSQIATWEEKRTDKWKGTVTQVSFFVGEDDYTIWRCLNYKGKIGGVKGGNNIFILENGVEPKIKGKGKGAKQKYIEELIGYSFELFKSSVIFGQKMKKIIEETGPQKKKIFEEAFEVAFIEDAKDNTKEELDKLKEAHRDIEIKIDSLLDKIADQEAFYEDALDNEKNFHKEKKADIKELNKEKKKLNKEIKDIESKTLKVPTSPGNIKKKIEKLEAKRDKALEDQYELDQHRVTLGDIERGMESNEQFLSKKETLCPTCGKPMSKEDSKKFRKKVEKELKELKAEWKKVNKTIDDWKVIDSDKLKIKIRELRDEKVKVERKITQAKEQNKRIPKIKAKILELDKKVRKLEKKKLKIKSNTYKKKITKLENTLNSEKLDLKNLQEQIDLKTWLIKDPLSNNGLKAYMFSSMLSQVNVALEEYSRILGFQVEFGIDLSTHRKDFYQAVLFEGVITPYEDLSGGQKQLVDTSVAFAIHDVVSKIRPTNILFMDEPFESLGTDEIEIIEELVERKSIGKSLFLITHHESFNPRNANLVTARRNKDGHTTIS